MEIPSEAWILSPFLINESLEQIDEKKNTYRNALGTIHTQTQHWDLICNVNPNFFTGVNFQGQQKFREASSKIRRKEGKRFNLLGPKSLQHKFHLYYFTLCPSAFFSSPAHGSPVLPLQWFCNSKKTKNTQALTQTIINPSCLFYSFRASYMELVGSYHSFYLHVPCTIRLSNTRVDFFLPSLHVMWQEGSQETTSSCCWCLDCNLPLVLGPCSEGGRRATYLLLSTCWRSWHGAASAGISGCSGII